MERDDDSVRLDKWLWAARFFKTRSLAAEAINGGKVQINGDRAKPSRSVRNGDRLTIRRGPVEWTVIVQEISSRRGPATVAQTLYEETQDSLANREAILAQLKLERPPEYDMGGRPSKRDRRVMERYTKRRW